MDAIQEKLFLELRQTQEEIVTSLKNKPKDEWISSILKEELADITAAIEKIETGKFGHCESSGELFPDHVLKNMPTIKSVKDAENIEHYYRKPINSSFF
jgi:RNA polymerase-binding transcription factor DksA